MSNRTAYRIAFWTILLIAAGIRLYALDTAPPGIHHDEASNGYDAYCLLKTGADRWGEHWPVLLEAFGRCDFRGAIHAYLMIPFHAIMGPDKLILSTRLPAALLGVITVCALFVAIRRTYDEETALWASALLAISPWHIQITRIGHESALTPAFTIAAVALLVTSIQPKTNGIKLKLSRLVMASMVMGLSVYTYPSMRLFTPLFLTVTALLCRREIASCLRPTEANAPINRRTAAIAIVVGLLIIAPMAWLTLTSPDRILARAAQTSVFHQSESFTAGLTLFLTQYAQHFTPNWLFLVGDRYQIQSPPGMGQIAIISAPFLLLGIFATIRQWRSSPISRILIAWLLLAPLAASATEGGPHALRSACGLGAYQWLTAIGIVSALAWAGKRKMLAASLIAVLVSANGLYTTSDYFGRRNHAPWVQAFYQADLLAAVKRIRPMVDRFDRVFISDQRDFQQRWYSGEPYIIVLLGLPVEPEAFQAWDKTIDYERETDGFHRVTSFGKFTMTTRQEVLSDHFSKHPRQSVLFVARPGEIGGGDILDVVRDAQGDIRFEIIAVIPRNRDNPAIPAK